MCGINGVTFKDEALIKAMVKATKHRGPDGEGVFVDEHISLGHNLLAITDSPDGCRQPAISQDGKYVLIYNGEIYNYKTLRKELGGLFRTGSDTEVLLAGLIKEGKDFIKKLNGMFAFAFYDVRKQTLLLARDAMGMKPLYYSLKNNKLIFSSEFRGLFAAGVPRQLDAEMEDVFLELGYIPGHRTLIKNVQKLTPGQGLEFDCNNGNLQTFWFSTSSRDLAPQHFDEAHLRDLLGSSVIDHTMGLRPFGMYLSGGLDSSIVLYELLQHGVKHVTTYTTRFDVADPKYNEDADIAARLSKDFDTKHHELLITEQNFMDALPKTIETLEEPRYHPSIPAYWLMAQEASKDTVVMLTGDGGDELFLGYPHYEESRRTKNSLWMTLSQTFKGKVAPGTYLNFRDPVVRWQFFHRVSRRFTKKTTQYLRSIAAPAVVDPTSDTENAFAELDRLFWLAEDSFTVSDKLQMHFGMEGRFPFIDRRVVEYAAAIPSSEKFSQPGSKGLVRKAYKDVLPSYVTEKRKTGWTAPVRVWMQSELGAYMREVIPEMPAGGWLPKTAFPRFMFALWMKQLNIQS